MNEKKVKKDIKVSTRNVKNSEEAAEVVKKMSKNHEK